MTDDRVEQIRAIPLFSSLSDEALARIADAATEFEANAGHVLVQPGQEGSGMFVLEEGKVVVERLGMSKEQGPGEFFGELALLAPLVRSARVRATTPVRCLAISRQAFSSILEAEPAIALAILRVLAQRLAEANA